MIFKKKFTKPNTVRYISCLLKKLIKKNNNFRVFYFKRLKKNLIKSSLI